jgi:hypothetical protein
VRHKVFGPTPSEEVIQNIHDLANQAQYALLHHQRLYRAVSVNLQPSSAEAIEGTERKRIPLKSLSLSLFFFLLNS